MTADMSLYLPLNDIEAMKNELAKRWCLRSDYRRYSRCGGIQLPTDEFMQALREACTAHNTILVLDEIQSGYGRSGKFFAHQYNGIKADIITVAKGIGNGFPNGRYTYQSDVHFPVYGQLGTTFGGNHLACSAVACCCLGRNRSENLVENAAMRSEYLMTELKSSRKSAVRGRVWWSVLKFEEPIKELRLNCWKNNMYSPVSAVPMYFRLLPPSASAWKKPISSSKRFRKVL